MGCKDYKSRTNKLLLEQYNRLGLEQAVILSYEILVNPKHKKKESFLPQVHGEVAETVLEMYVKDYIQKNNLNWIYSRGLILKDLNNINSEYLTEIDFVLFTPFKICAFECKSYKGYKVLADKCTIRRKGLKAFDLYQQHSKHVEAIYKNFSPCKLNSEDSLKYAPIMACYFDFSEGKVFDKREEIWKKRLKFTNIANINKVLDCLNNDHVCYDMKAISKCLSIIEKNKNKYTDKHLKYVKSLHK